MPKTLNDNSNYINQIKLKLEKLKNGNLKKVHVDLTKINIKTLASKVGVLSEDVKLYMELLTSNRYYPLNDRTINLLMKGDIDMSVTIGDEVEQIKDSDSEVVKLFAQEKEVEISVVNTGKTRSGGAFFPFLNNTIFDLSKYGIFKKVDRTNYKHNCLYLALQEGGLSDIKLQELILTLRNRHIHKCDLSKVCNALKINIELISIRNDGKKSDVEHYPTCPYIEYNEKYNLGLVKGHYFINDYTELTSYCLEHYEEVKEIKECNKIYNKLNDKYKKRNDRFITSFQLFKILIDNVDKLIIPMELSDEVLNTQFYDKVEDYKTLEYNENNCKLQKYEETSKNYYKIFFDFETITSEKTHMPYLCWIYNDDMQKEFIGINTCAVDMLNALPTNKGDLLLIAHNSDYDCRFILEYITTVKPIVKSNRFLYIDATYYNPVSKKKINIKIKDSYKLIPKPLSKFGECFKLDCYKEVMPYNVYTYENVSMGACSIQTALDSLKDDDKQQFLDNLEKWDCILGKGMFDLIKYSSIYCKMDCKVLKEGYEVFRGWMLEHTELDVDHFITIQSLASTYMLKSGCYDGVYQFSSVIQQFITKCVVGGRVMTANNKQYHVKKKIADFDACSLYPSAMYFMKGFLKGKPKVLTNKDYNFLEQQDGYFIRIKIIKLNKHLDFPLTSKINEETGVRDFTNDMENEIISIDKVGLEDLITFHDAEFEIIDGYYFNEGRNNKINHVIKDLYDLRKKLKKEKNPAQEIIKLLMNSMFGKTIIKPVETDTIVKDNKDDFEKYIAYNYNYIDSVIEVNNKFYIKKVKSILKHFNYVHCGVEILSMSKRIMNRVFDSASKCGVKIYYQDTDSMHLNYDDVDKVVDKYKEIYNADLIGEELGNFHVDFPKKEGYDEVYCIESLFLGKKTYLDILEYVAKNGNKINDNLIRLKGIPTSCIEYHAEKEKKSVLDIYKDFYNNKTIEFDLTNNGNKFVCRNNKDHTVYSLSHGDIGSIRKCQFIRNENDKIFIN